MNEAQHKTSTFIKSCLVFISGLCLAWHTIAATEFKILTLQHRFAEEILPAILPLVGNQGSASAIKNNLIIRTSPENMAEIEQVINALDTEPQNLIITISRSQNQGSEISNNEVSGRIHMGNVVARTGNNRQITRNGATLNIKKQKHINNFSGNQFVQVVNGGTAFISVGQFIPYTQEWINLTHRYANAQGTTDFFTFDSGFAIHPRIIGNQVELEVTPRFSQLSQNRMIDFETLTTVMRTERGKWMD